MPYPEAMNQNLPGNYSQFPLLNPLQQRAQNQALTTALSGLQNRQQPSFDPIANQARRQFQTQTIPTIAERFTSMPGAGSQRSSAFTGALGNAGSQLESNLASLQSQFNLSNQAQENSLLSHLLQLGLGHNYEGALTNNPSFGSSLAPAASTFARLLPLLIAVGFGGLTGGPAGAVAGGASQLPALLSSGFGGGSSQGQFGQAFNPGGAFHLSY